MTETLTPLSPEDEISLGMYVRPLVQRWKWIVVVGFVGAAIGMVSGLTAPVSYEARVTLLVARSRLVDAPLIPPSLPTFRTLVQNRSIAGRVIDELGLADAPHFLNAASFVDQNVRVERIADTNLLLTTVQLGDPEIAAQAANRIAELAVELNDQISQYEVTSHENMLQQQLVVAQGRVESRRSEWLAFQRRAQLELVRADANALVAERRRARELTALIGAERARLAQATAEIKDHDKILTVRRSIDNEPALLQAASETSSNGGSLLGLELRYEMLNPVYETVANEIVLSASRLAALESEHDQLTSRLGAEAETLGDLHDGEMALAAIEAELQVAETVFSELASQYEQARARVDSRNELVQIVDPALVPLEPTSPAGSSNAILGFFAGVLVAAVLSMAADARLSSQGIPSRTSA